MKTRMALAVTTALIASLGGAGASQARQAPTAQTQAEVVLGVQAQTREDEIDDLREDRGLCGAQLCLPGLNALVSRTDAVANTAALIHRHSQRGLSRCVANRCRKRSGHARAAPGRGRGCGPNRPVNSTRW